MNRYNNFILLIIMISSITFAAPVTTFISPPTPNDGATQSSTTVNLKVDVTEANLETFTFNWDGTNYTMYNDSLILMLNFNSFNALSDFSQGGNNGAAQGGASSTDSGKYYEAYTFDGDGDYIIVTDNNIDTTGDFSVELWIKPDKVDIQSGIIMKDTNTGIKHEYTAEFQIQTRTNNQIRFTMGSQTSWAWSNAESSADAIEVGKWYYIVGTVKGTTQKLYLDGVEVATTSTIGARRADAGIPVWIGRSDDTDGMSSAQYFNGSVDEVRIWDRALTSFEINQSYISNFRKYDADSWEYTTTKTGLAYATFDYQAYASDTGGVFGNTEERDVTISASVSGGGAGVPEFSGASIIACLISGIAGNFLFFRKQTPTVN